MATPETEVSYLVTSCPSHGVVVAPDVETALLMQEVAHDCQQRALFSSYHGHEAGVSCWHCCHDMSVAPGVVLV